MQHQFFKESRIASGEDIACIWPRHCHEKRVSRSEFELDNTR
jgi:hypothetical protein